DGLQHVGGRRLLLQGLRQFCRARLNAFEQSHILDCDRRLVSECRYELDLFVGERANLRARQSENADGFSLPQHWNANDSAKCPKAFGFRERVLGILLNVGNVDDFAFEERASGSRPSFRLDRDSPYILHEPWREPMGFSAIELAVDLPGDGRL